MSKSKGGIHAVDVAGLSCCIQGTVLLVLHCMQIRLDLNADTHG